MDPDLVGAAGLEPALETGGQPGGVIGPPPGSAVRAARPPARRRPGWGRHPTARGGHRSRPRRLPPGPHEGGVAVERTSRQLRRQRPAGRRSVRATISSPDVPLSSRWTMPGRSVGPVLGQRGQVGIGGQEALDEGPAGVAGAGMDDQPGRFVHDDHLCVARTRRRRHDLLPGRSSRSGAAADRTGPPAPAPGRTRRPRTGTRPSRPPSPALSSMAATSARDNPVKGDGPVDPLTVEGDRDGLDDLDPARLDAPRRRR